MPKVAFEAFAQVLGSEVPALERVHRQLKNMISQNQPQNNELSKLKANIEAFGDLTKKYFKTITKGITVNCWHANTSESEAMWKLYSDNGKGIAVKTSISSLVKAIEHFDQKLFITIGAVKYLDFHDPKICSEDCITDGYLSPLLKRSSFSHENEVRLFTVPKIDDNTLDSFIPKPEVVQALALELVEEIYITPFAGEPFVSSVFAICNKYSIPNKVIHKSTLLVGHEDLLDSIVEW